MKLFWTFGSTLESNYNNCWLHLPSSAKNAFSRATLLSTNTSLLYFSRYLYLSIYFSDSFFIFTATNICTFYFWHFLFHSHSRWIWIILILCRCAPPSQHHKSHCVLRNWQHAETDIGMWRKGALESRICRNPAALWPDFLIFLTQSLQCDYERRLIWRELQVALHRNSR